MEEQNSNNPSEELQGAQQEQPVVKNKGGRPKGVKNKPKRGRPKGSGKKRPVGRPPVFKKDGKVIKIPTVRQFKKKEKKEEIVVPQTLEAKPVKKSKAPETTENDLLNAVLDDEKFTEAGYNTSTQKIINQEPIDPSYYYRGSKNVPIAGAQYEFTADMINELVKCKDDIVYFAENFFYIVNLDRGKETIKLYDAQKEALRTLVENRFVSLLSCRQAGKALSLNTPIATTKGWKKLGELTLEDQIYGSDGQPINITHLHPIEHNRPCYKVTFDNGETIIADEDHEWFTQTRRERHTGKQGSIKTTKQIKDSLKVWRSSSEPNHRIPMVLNGLENNQKELPIDPYILGLWIGDGSKDSGSITVGKRDIDHVYDKLKTNNQFDKLTIKKYSYTDAYYIRITSNNCIQTKSLTALIKKHGLFKNKHIPEEYFTASREQKIQLLTGLMDSDGYIEKNNGVAVFYTSCQHISDQVRRLITEVGYKTSIQIKQAKLRGVNKKLSYGITFKPREIVATIPFKFERLKCESLTQHHPQKRSQFHYITDIQSCKSVPVRCITVNSKDSLFLAGKNLIPTHNSTILTIFALWMVCFNDDHRAAIVANKETTAVNIFKRIRMAYEQLPNYIKPGVKDYAKTGMTLGNDSSIIVSTTTATSIRGDSLNTLAIDEAAFIEGHILEEFWSSVIPAISSGKKSKILMVSTPNSTNNKFYEIFSGAENGTIKQWKSQRIDWWQVPGRDEKWKQDMIAVLGSEEKFLQEFGNQFLDDSTSAVGALLIEKFKQTKKPAIWTSEEGDYSVFEYPDKNRLYVIGVDVGEGIGRAASVAQVLDVTDLQDIKQVAVYGSAVIEPYHFANKLLTIGQSWGLPPMLIERNNCGAQVIDALHYHHNYEKIVAYSKISTSDKYNTTRNLGVLSHTNIRSDGIGNMRYWVNHLQCVQINDPQTISEFETFVKHPNGVYKKRTDKFFDDRIMALTWALFILKTEIVEQYFQIVDFDLQNHPLKIVPNGYWENFSENYDLKDLSKNPSVVPKPAAEDSLAYPALGITQKELETLDKYDLDEDSLLEMGYTYFNQDV